MVGSDCGEQCECFGPSAVEQSAGTFRKSNLFGSALLIEVSSFAILHFLPAERLRELSLLL